MADLCTQDNLNNPPQQHRSSTMIQQEYSSAYTKIFFSTIEEYYCRAGRNQKCQINGFWYILTFIMILISLIDKNKATTCQSSCYTCDNSTECTSCIQYMMMNSTSKLCQFCSDGQFYAQSINSCIDCGTSCTSYCAYRSTCYDCPSGQLYDIDLMTCVQSCNTTTQISINSTQTGSKAYCRSFNYYVNPLSTEVVELGSK